MLGEALGAVGRTQKQTQSCVGIALVEATGKNLSCSSKTMETATKGECKDEKRREQDVLVVDISEGREKPAARRPAKRVVSLGSKVSGPSKLM